MSGEGYNLWPIPEDQVSEIERKFAILRPHIRLGLLSADTVAWYLEKYDLVPHDVLF